MHIRDSGRMASRLLFQHVPNFFFSLLIGLKQSFRAFTCLRIKHKPSFNPDRHSFGMQRKRFWKCNVPDNSISHHGNSNQPEVALAGGSHHGSEALAVIGTGISALCSELTAALTEELAENAVDGRVAADSLRVVPPSRSTPNTTNMTTFWRWGLHLNYPCFVARLGGVSGGKETQG
jgi:hypothetical protein